MNIVHTQQNGLRRIADSGGRRFLIDLPDNVSFKTFCRGVLSGFSLEIFRRVTSDAFGNEHRCKEKNFGPPGKIGENGAI